MSIYKRGDSWCYDFWVRGTRYRGAIGEVSRKVAKEVHDKKRVEALEGRLVVRPVEAPLFGHYIDEKDTFDGAAGEYLQYYRANRKPSSAERARVSLLALSKTFANKRLSDITAKHVEEYKHSRIAQDKAVATVNRELACLKNLFSMAIVWEFVAENPVRKVKSFKENNQRHRFLTPEEEAELLKHCGFRMRVRLIVALDTGFRASEIASLLWKDIDWANREIGVRSGYTKNGEPRRIPMTKRLIQMLTLLKGTNNVSLEDFVLGPFRYTKAFHKAREKAKLGKDVVFHTMRHTFISRLAMRDGRLPVIQGLAGHRDIRMTMRYAHLTTADKRRAIEALESEVPTKVPASPIGEAVSA